MAQYRALVDILIAHESRVVKAGEVFTTEFPKVKQADGTEVDMKLGSNLELVEEEKPTPKKGGKQATDGGKQATDGGDLV